jgi:hypothetical protein
MLAALPLAAGGAQQERFRYTLRDDPTLPADVRRQIDSLQAIHDSIHRCPSRADTVWATDPHQAIPPHWLKASVNQGCAHSSLPDVVRRRLRDDTASLSFYAAIARRAIPATPTERVWALLQLSWSADLRFFPLILEAARSGRSDLDRVADDYNLAYRATIELAPYLHSSREARAVVMRAASAPRSRRYERQAGILALAAANDPTSRAALLRLSLGGLDPAQRATVRRALANAPCLPGTIFVEWFGIEGQNFSKCELPPDYR